MRKRSNIMVMDTETTGDFGSPMIYDFGYIVIDKDLNEVVRRNYLIKEIFENNFLMRSAYYFSKKSMYDKMVENNEVEVLPFIEIMKIYIKDLNTYKVKTVSAYNLAFDIRAITATSNLLGYAIQEKISKAFDKVNLLCLWNLSTDSFMQSEEYEKFCIDNNCVSEANNLKTSAEVAYRFITQNADFIESHTALHDSEIETEILRHIINNCKGKMNYGLFFNCWSKVPYNKKG